MCIIILTALILLGAGFGAGSLEARDIYVDNVGGDDIYSGFAPRALSPEQGPCRTIARALRLAEKSDRIILANTGEPYRESLTLQGGKHSGTQDRPFIIEGNGAILEGAEPVSRDAWESHRDDLFRFQPTHRAYHQLFFNGLPLTRHPASNSPGWLPPLEPLEWTLLNSHIYFRVDVDLYTLPQHYEITHSVRPVGITLYEARHVVIQNLIVQGFYLDGVNCHDNAHAALVELNCRGNGRSGISIGGASRVLVEACLIGNNGTAQLRTEGYCRAEVLNSDIIGNTAPAVVKEGGHLSIDGEIIIQ